MLNPAVGEDGGAAEDIRPMSNVVGASVSVHCSPPPQLKLKENPVEEWKFFKQMYKHYSILCRIREQNKEFQISSFLNSVGPVGLRIYNKLQFLSTEEEDVELVMRKLDGYIIGEINVTYQRYVFNKRAQQIGESIEDYVSVLRTLGSARCRKLDSYPCQPTEKCVEDCQQQAGYKCEVLVNIAKGKPAIQAKDFAGRPASRAVDGNLATNWAYSSCTQADYWNGVHAWWRVSFGKTARVYTVKITNRGDCCGSRLSNFNIRIGDSTTGRGSENAACATKASVPTGGTSTFRCYPYLDGKYLYVQDNLADVLTICETQVFGELLN